MFKLGRLSDPRVIIICVLVALAVTGLVKRMERAVKPVKPRVAAVHEVPVSELPAFSDKTLNAPGLRLSVRRTLQRLSLMKDDASVSWAGGRVTAADMKHTLEQFMELLDENLSSEDFRKKLAQGFRVFRVMDCSKTGDDTHPVLVTGYFQPELRASLTGSQEFYYPLYGVPDNLIQVNLRLFDPELPAGRLWGRVAGKKLLPYYTREEIDTGRVRIDAPVLAWLASPVDGLMLHIQGSGRLRFSGAESRYIHFAASNGRSYGSLGKWLIKRGWLRPEDADWPGIKRWAERNPEKFQEALKANPRYIFFKWEEDGPVGSLGAVLVPMRSVALDPAVFPQGALCFLNIPGEAVAGNSQWRFSGFVMNQDRGSAIRGPCRVDLYCGEGERAGSTAGKLRHRGDLYILLKR